MGRRAWQEEEEREKEHRRQAKKLSDEHWERVRNASIFSPWVLLTILLFLIASFIFFSYGIVRTTSRKPVQDAVKTSAPQGQAPQTTRRAGKQATPANHERK